MRGNFICVKKGKDFYNKDILDATYEERSIWYKSLSKEQMVNLLEKFIINEIAEDND
ncbi:hypothetical protein [Clostridium sp.]|uniref:hypothetical protein n=1 Tax=Clostridium sp. TaxID=1506 RepID=UPI001A64451E|nr:hypothetical protein [Clostridium sp.]MBK5242013.1 hypothetical protein [Clostridium sp.]